MQLNIIYEDKDMLVCFKPAGIATQTASLSHQDMVSMIKNYLAKQGAGKSPYVGVIHRLDQPVSGLLVFAKNQKSAAGLSKQIQDGNVNKDYIAFCSGVLEKKKGTLCHYIMKDSMSKLAKVLDEEQFVQYKESDTRYSVQIHEYDKIQKAQLQESNEMQLIQKGRLDKEKTISSYKKAILTYEIEKEFEDSSIVKIHLQTGRFHQIRAQFSAIGHALLGDEKYSTVESRKLSIEKRISEIALCANHLIFKHPVTGKEMEFFLEEKYLPNWYGNKNRK